MTALSYTIANTDGDLMPGGVPTGFDGAITTTAGSLLVIMIRVEADTVSEDEAHWTVAGSCISGVTFLGSKHMGGSTTKGLDFYSAAGTGNTSTIATSYSGSGILFVGGVTDNMQGTAIEVTGASGLTVQQSKIAVGTNATASVTLDNAVLSGNECLYMAQWLDPADDATPGSGWTELQDQGWQARHYTQYHPTPTGAQNGQVSAIASQSFGALILEINNPSVSRGGGFGAIPIK